MKKIIAIILIMGGVMTSFAQVPTKMFEKNMAFEKYPGFQISRSNAPEKTMPAFDVTPLLEEDKAVEGMDYPFKFGKSFDVNLDLNDGKWVKTDSTEIWSLKISSPKAYSLNFIFSELYLPEGAELHVFNEDGSMVYGPVTEKQNQHGRTYLTDIIQGESAIFQLAMPLNTKESPSLVIQKTIHGYKNLFKSLKTGYGDAGECFDDYDSDVVCYPAWNNESDGVVQILLSDGTELCSGSLLNNTNQDYRPYVLTAFHCIDIGIDTAYQSGFLDQNEIDQAEEWLVRFRFRHRYCTDSEYIFANVITFDDTQFRAAWNATDFALVELQDDILRDVFSVGQKVWLGWDRSGNTPSSGTCIHHPSGDIAKISFENNSLTETSYLQSSGTSHWRVYNWDYGVTENGSSGSPLFDQNKRVVGQLHGGYSSCDDPDDPDWYGCFHRSWTGDSTNATRLSNWLDPLGTGVTTLNSVRPNPEYSGITEQLCSTTTFSVTSLPPGYTFQQWNGNNVTFSNNTSNPVQVTPMSNGEAWVEAVVHTGWGNYTMERQVFWNGTPSTAQFDIRNIDTYGNNTLMPGMYNQLIANDYDYQTGTTEWEWDCGGWYHVDVTTTKMISYVDVPYSFSYKDISVRLYNTCGPSQWYTERFYPDEGYFLVLTPNPATGETTLTIETNSAEKTFDETAEWELEVYSETQLLKTKQTSLRGQSAKIQTAGWKEGVYMVRVNYNGEVLTGKLLVKR